MSCRRPQSAHFGVIAFQFAQSSRQWAQDRLGVSMMRRKASSRLLCPSCWLSRCCAIRHGSGRGGRSAGRSVQGAAGRRQQETAPAPAPAPQPAAQQLPPPATVDSKRVPFGRAEIELSFAPLVKNTAPAVVNVYASQKVAARSPFAGDPFFEQFFGDQRMPPRVQQSLGSGVLVDPSRHRRHQFPCDPRRRHGQGRDLRRPRIRKQGAVEGQVARSCRAQDRSAAAISR